MEETFAQIDEASQHSLSDVSVSITAGGSIIGQGVTASDNAVGICGGNLDSILKSFGGIEGGDQTFGGKAKAVVTKSTKYGSKIGSSMEKKKEELGQYASDLEQFSSIAHSALQGIEDADIKAVLYRIFKQVESAASSIRKMSDEKVGDQKQSIEEFKARNEQFVKAIESLGSKLTNSTKAGMLSLSFTSVNDLKKLAAKANRALKVVELEKDQFLKSSLSELDGELTKALSSKDASNKEEVKQFLKAWMTLLEAHGHMSDLKDHLKQGGALTTTSRLAERLKASRNELKTIINKFIDAFANDINGMVKAAETMSVDLGKGIDYDEKTIAFLDQFERLSEYLSDNDRKSKIYQHLLELNIDQIDSKEIKDRFLSSMRVLSEKASAVDSVASSKAFTKACVDVISTVNKYCDMVKTHRDAAKKEGGSTETMNELFSVDASKIDINGLLVPLDGLKVVINKINFFRNIAVFRSNLRQTNKELAVYSKDYTKSVGKAIGEAITKIKNEYSDIIGQIDDNKAGMGLEIDMYNESQASGDKISKEKLKQMYKWQCDARVGLYKTVEAIDLYLLHFTDSISKNPDAVADLHKLLSATKIVAKWYDAKAGDNIIRVFESFAQPVAGAVVADIDSQQFIDDYNQRAADTDITDKLSGDKATKVYERCRRAVEGVVVLKNIISYFITIGEKYGDFKSEKNIYMAPSNIYKNLVNYIWVSAIDVNTSGTEILNENNETKRIMSFEDAKIRLAMIDKSIDPETFGINFSKHSMDKLRIMKCHQELLRLKDFTSSIDDEDLNRIKQFVTGVFARLGKTDYIFSMVKFGVYDLTQMDKPMIIRFLNYVRELNPILGSIEITTDGRNFAPLPNDVTATADIIARLNAAERNQNVAIKIVNAAGADVTSLKNLKSFQGLSAAVFEELVGMIGYTSNATGFLRGFLRALTNGDEGSIKNIGLASRAVSALHYVIMEMVNKYKSTHQSGAFAIDDTYFVLTIKAIAGKIMAVTGVNRLLKDPNDHKNIISKNHARLIMGGAEGDVDVIDEAVELYVRLPLLVEFYRSIFDNGNKEYINEDVTGALDEERVSFVPEIGNVWSGLILNVFEKSKHIENGVYTQDNIRKIVSEINSIYKHYKGSVKGDELTRHIISELVAEINRRYGVIKRQELVDYYKVMNATKRANTQTEFIESNYSINDFDILDEANEFEQNSPSEEFIKLKNSISDPKTPVETKINKLTDYKILKDFRERIESNLSNVEDYARDGENPNGKILSLKDRIRLLKKAIVTKSSRDEKYSMIIKAIEETDSINQSSNDIFTCFHEFVIMPLRTAYQMHNALDTFITTMYRVFETADIPASDPINEYKTLFGGNTTQLTTAIKSYANNNLSKISNNNVLIIDGSRAIMTGPNNTIVRELCPLAFLQTLTQFATNSGGLVKLNISTTKRITIDFSEYQKVCEHLVANVKYMVDKFTGLVPSALISKATRPDLPGGLYWLEKNLINGIFNKMNKGEKDRDIACIDNINKIMPTVSNVIFNNGIPYDELISCMYMHKPRASVSTSAAEALPAIRDAFMTYNRQARMYITPRMEAGPPAISESPYISNLLFNPKGDSSMLPADQPNYGIIQQFNTLISRYLNDLYDSQSRKIYTKSFATFAGSALIDALNGQSFPDFENANNRMRQLFTVGANPIILSSTLAYTMKVLMNRTHPTTGVKLHEVLSIQDLSPHILEKYRMVIPMYLRIFKAFIERCKIYRKVLGAVSVSAASNNLFAFSPAGQTATNIREFNEETNRPFASTMSRLDVANQARLNPVDHHQQIRDTLAQQIDEIVNGMTSLLQDVEAVQKELLETDTTVSLYFDVKKDFTKNYLSSVKELPFAPLSILSMAYSNNASNRITPLHQPNSIVDNKFLYGIRSLLMNDFKMSSSTVPYLKKLINDFNGYSTSGNTIPEDKFNTMLEYVSKSVNYIYDLRYFNGQAISHADLLSGSFGRDPRTLATYQESVPKANSLSIIESVNVVDSSDKVANHVKNNSLAILGNLAAIQPRHNRTNPRDRVIVVNIIDLNIMPINVHSLMREIPLANLYNYSMTYDSIIGSMKGIEQFEKNILTKPYKVINGAAGQIPDKIRDYRFLGDQMLGRILKIVPAPPAQGAAPLPLLAVSQNSEKRLDSKLFRNLTFLTLVQVAIKQKVKTELEFINTRVVTNVASVSDTITNGVPAVDENLFEF